MSAKSTNQSGPKTAFGRFMVYKFIPNYANNVQGLVYMGAALLIIIVGLRGLGTAAAKVGFVSFLLDPATSKVSVSWVLGALFLEFFLLFVMAVVTFFTPEEMGGGAESHAKTSASQSDEIIKIKQSLRELKEVADEDIKVLNDYVESINNVNKKLVQAKADFFKSLTELKTLFK